MDDVGDRRQVIDRHARRFAGDEQRFNFRLEF